MPHELLDRRDVHQAVPEPFGPAVRIGDTAAVALDLMIAGSHELLPVLTEDVEGQFAGVVLRKALENGCVRMGHDPSTCRLHNHLKTDVGVVESSTAAATSSRAARPVVIVDALRRPIGYLPVDG